MRRLRITLLVIGVVQLFFGVAFLVAPRATAGLLGLHEAAPPWANWLFAMMAARFLGYAVGMFATARAAQPGNAWVDTMIAIQAVDWLATLTYLINGDVTLRQVSTASFLPVLFIVALLVWHPRRLARTSGPVQPALLRTERG
jgi:hypothetical protein